MQTEWIALGYSVPASPSKLRVMVWRKLRALGALALYPGLAVLPNRPENVEIFLQLRQKIHELSGEATLLELNLPDAAEANRLRERFANAEAQRMQEVFLECKDLLRRIEASDGPAERAALRRSLSKRLEQLEASSQALSTGPRGRTAEQDEGFGSLIDTLRDMSGDFVSLLRGKTK